MPICRLILLSLALTVGLASQVSLEAQALPAADDQGVATAPVELDGVVLFNVRGATSFPAEARARVIQERIEAVARDASVRVDSLQVVEREGTLQIVAGDRLIVGVLEADAGLEGITAAELAVAHLIRLRQAVADYRVARSAPALRQSAIATVVATFLFVLSVGVAVWFWRWLDRRLTARFHARVHTVGIQSFEVMRADRIWRALRSGLYALRALVLIAISLTYVAYVLARWPWTRGLSRDLVAVALGPLELIGRGVVAHIPSLVFLAVLFFVFRFCLKVLRLFFEAVGRGTVTLGGFDAEWAQPTYKIVRAAVVAFGLIVAYPYIPGSQSAAFKGVSLFIGVVFSLGSSSAISNIIAGYMMTYRRAFKVGDRVKIGDSVGDVIEMRLQVTHLRSLKNEEIVIPNSQILAGEVLNYSSLARTHGLLLHTEVGIGYETPWRQVEAMLLAAAARTPGLQSEPRPFVLMKKLGDFCVTYELNVSCGDARAALEIYTTLHGHILDIFNEYGVQIMTPAYVHDPVEPKVVAPGDWHIPPASPPAGAPMGPGQP